ncbi:hypothetical protein BKA70DRAFT_1467259 [Coprinopsis sp. MPI-PUGE-AT-0042]|nr:hypothetical protein BKA70DRAFT_1467259 [Coprinopsis sp. MPI-PUGE-AT-0042]
MWPRTLWTELKWANLTERMLAHSARKNRGGHEQELMALQAKSKHLAEHHDKQSNVEKQKDARPPPQQAQGSTLYLVGEGAEQGRSFPPAESKECETILARHQDLKADLHKGVSDLTKEKEGRQQDMEFGQSERPLTKQTIARPILEQKVLNRMNRKDLLKELVIVVDRWLRNCKLEELQTKANGASPYKDSSQLAGVTTWEEQEELDEADFDDSSLTGMITATGGLHPSSTICLF